MIVKHPGIKAQVTATLGDGHHCGPSKGECYLGHVQQTNMFPHGCVQGAVRQEVSTARIYMCRAEQTLARE